MSPSDHSELRWGKLLAKKRLRPGIIVVTKIVRKCRIMRQANIQQPTSANKLKQNISESLAAIDENTKPSHRQERKQKREKKVNYQDYSCDYRNYYCNCGGLAAIKIMADDELGVP
ncbi:hypothetical protein KOY48_01245 [Candidatus Minimicrobia naudis]|uniref:Uncharacterized protein n=1 Tax=Candidatus Minimicrobia naudis TaxID=2841263 RepID=A0A8F1MCP7_9BACT|nr:hypothetical protein KOY48_01245 [Candidatus Minimicrobia naudis]